MPLYDGPFLCTFISTRIYLCMHLTRSSGKVICSTLEAVESVVRICRPDTSSLKPKAGAAPKKGMQLGKARKANDFLESLRAEGEVIQVSH